MQCDVIYKSIVFEQERKVTKEKKIRENGER